MKLMASEAFGSAIDGSIPELGKIVEMVVMAQRLRQMLMPM